MIPNLMSLSDSTIHCFTVPFDAISDHEEGGFDVMFGENIQQPIGIRGMRPIIESECDDLFIRIQANNILSEGGSKVNP